MKATKRLSDPILTLDFGDMQQLKPLNEYDNIDDVLLELMKHSNIPTVKSTYDDIPIDDIDGYLAVKRAITRDITDNAIYKQLKTTKTDIPNPKSFILDLLHIRVEQILKLRHTRINILYKREKTSPDQLTKRDKIKFDDIFKDETLAINLLEDTLKNVIEMTSFSSIERIDEVMRLIRTKLKPDKSLYGLKGKELKKGLAEQTNKESEIYLKIIA